MRREFCTPVENKCPPQAKILKIYAFLLILEHFSINLTIKFANIVVRFWSDYTIKLMEIRSNRTNFMGTKTGGLESAADPSGSDRIWGGVR